MEGPLEDRARRALILTCEHASNALPDGYALPPGLAASHWAFDPGAREIAEELGSRLRATPLLGPWSRLWVDLNRSEGEAEVARSEVEGAPIAFNVGCALEDRICRYHRPWREEARRRVDAALPALHLSVHTFTPTLGGVRRDLEAGVLFDPSRPAEVEIAERLLAALRRAGVDARANQPYAGVDDGHTTTLRRIHGDERYAGIETELRHDLALRPDARARFVDAVATTLASWASS